MSLFRLRSLMGQDSADVGPNTPIVLSTCYVNSNSTSRVTVNDRRLVHGRTGTPVDCAGAMPAAIMPYRSGVIFGSASDDKLDVDE